MLVAPPQGIIASSHRSTVIRSLFEWGRNNYGQLGDGTTANKSSPVPIGAATNWTAVAASGLTSLGVMSGGLFTWGQATFGQLGDGTTANKSSPVPIGAATNWTAVAGGGRTSLGISAGALFSWGANNAGELGDGTTANKSSPVPIGAATNWTAVAGGGSGPSGFSLGIRGGALFAWGRNSYGQLGDGTTVSKSSPVPIGAATNWTVVAGGGGAGTSATGRSFSIGIRGGALFAWGYNSYGQLGDGTTVSKSSPVPIGAATNWTVVAGGGNSNYNGTSLGISGGALFAWGRNNTGAFGDGTTANKSSPVPIGAATNWTVVAAGSGFSLGASGGALFAWGSNSYGQLGDGTTAAKSSPVPIGALTSWKNLAACSSNASFNSIGTRS